MYSVQALTARKTLGRRTTQHQRCVCSKWIPLGDEENIYGTGKKVVVGGTVASWLVRLTPEQAVRVRAHCVVFLGKTLTVQPETIYSFTEVLPQLIRRLTPCSRLGNDTACQNFTEVLPRFATT